MAAPVWVSGRSRRCAGRASARGRCRCSSRLAPRSERTAPAAGAARYGDHRPTASSDPRERRQLRVSAMTRSETLPSSGALEEVRRLAGPSAVVRGAARLEGGQHADTWRVDTENPAISVVVRQFPVDDPAPLREQRVLRALDGLGGLAPVLLGGDLTGRWSKYPASLISWLDGQPDITPTDPR